MRQDAIVEQMKIVDSDSNSNIKIARGISLIVGCLLAIASFVATMTPNVFESPVGSSPVLQSMRSIVPQGWAFFTRDARESTYSAYQETEHGWVPIVPISGGATRFAFGLNRGARLVDGDLALIAATKTFEGTTENAWSECLPRESPEECVQRLSLQANGQQRVRSLIGETCGRILVISSETIPWSYGKMTRDHKKSARIVEVECV